MTFTCALVGADGSGKSTIAQRLVKELSLPMRYVYMGINLESSNLVLPTTRLILEIKRFRGGRPDMVGPSRPRVASAREDPVRRVVSQVRSVVRMANLVAEEWFRQVVVWFYQWRGHVVLLDRHFFLDQYAHDVSAGRDAPLVNRLHGAMLRRLYPRPDVVIMLDAPPEVLFARKGEGTVELLEGRRQEYLEARSEVREFHLVDASLTEDEVAERVAEIVQSRYAAVSGGAGGRATLQRKGDG